LNAAIGLIVTIVRPPIEALLEPWEVAARRLA